MNTVPHRVLPTTAIAGRPVAIIDIGSNSVRLVAFEGLTRAPLPVFNEKILCGLGRGIAETGRLHEEGRVQAIETIRRFAMLTRAMGADLIDVVATAAVRDANNGADFVRTVEQECGVKVRILSGTDEAQLAAFGVLAGMPDADGTAGDLGGGSLELVTIRDHGLTGQATLPIGPLRLMGRRGGRDPAIVAEIDRALEGVSWIAQARNKPFYAVGGAWRSFAKLHMAQHRYPLKVIHHYTVPRRSALELARLVAGFGRESLENMEGVSKRRREVLPTASLILERLLRVAEPSEVIFSSFGLREGLLFARLDEATREQDPFLAACRDVGVLGSRFAYHADEIDNWMGDLFDDGPRVEARLRYAATLLSDVAWRAHPDYRAEQALNRILHAPLVGVDHASRAFVAYAVCTRYRGGRAGDGVEVALRLLPPDMAARARVVGLALDVAHTLSGGSPGILAKMRLEKGAEELVLHVPKALEPIVGDLVFRRFRSLGQALNRGARLVTV